MELNDSYMNPENTQSESVPRTPPVQEPAPQYRPAPEPQYQPVQEPVRPASPFADSPYVGYQVQYQYRQPPKPKAKKDSKAGKVILCIILALALIAGSSAVTAVVMNHLWEEKADLLRDSMNEKIGVLQNQVAQGGVSVTPTMPVGEGLTPSQIYQKNVQAVVAITCYVQQNGYYQSETYQSFGSGFIISKDGYVVTNHHVIEGATEIWVNMTNGEEYVAKLIGSEAGDDVALLKIEGNNFPCVTIGSSDKLVVGDQVVAIGNPLGELTSTLTVGYVSAKDRVVNTDGTAQSMFQTDAAINSGNSGGPLFNSAGEVVGITTAKYSGTSASGASIEGIGFAIPIDDVMGMLDDLKEFGYVTGAYIGVYVRDVDANAQSYGIPAGAYVENNIPGYAAEKAGIKAGDIIVDVGGYEVRSVSELTRVLRRFEGGQTTVVTVYRSGSMVELSITLDEKPVEAEPAAPAAREDQTYPMPGEEGFEDWYRDFFKDFFG